MCSPHRTIDVQTWRIFFSFFPSPNSNRFVDSARTGMRIKSGSNVSDPDVWFHAFEDYSHRSSPSREQNSTRATDPRESNSGLENDIYYNRGAVFIVPKDYHILETNSIHIAVLLEKKKKNTFLLKLYRFPRFRLVFIIECTARWPWRGRASPVVSIESSRKNGSPRNKVALRPWDRLKRRETMMEIEDSIKSTMDNFSKL